MSAFDNSTIQNCNLEKKTPQFVQAITGKNKNKDQV